jgi:hypothetical protein
MFDLNRIFICEEFKESEKSGTCFQFPFTFDLTRYLNKTESPQTYDEVVEYSKKEKLFQEYRIGDIDGKSIND